ncbi:unnamed protein product [Rotaria sordida]|uniref:Uncharacterized protein n=1 Tax=Rotaria sordida TaxID=392033 RepID=A0A815ZX04_9BILA|nr:unnamed protein product [Rotaria sordida]CAF1588237.1 unnamed protein product [Rotaria sordida]
MYDNISSECNKTQCLSEAQRKTFLAISKLLIALREQLVSYPNEYFHGRGIVLTTGSNQLKFTKVNLKMMEFSGTRLNVQVNIINQQQYLVPLFAEVLFLDSDSYIVRDPENLCGEHEYELDSAAILVDKKRVWKGLYITKLMNDNHELFYKHVSGGDKDTFRFGFRYVNVKYYIVMIPCSTGAFNDTHFCG